MVVLQDPPGTLPAPGSADDPVAKGLVLSVFGRTSRTVAHLVALPGAGKPGWKARAMPRVSYDYADPSAPSGGSLLSKAQLRDGAQLRLRAPSVALALTAPEDSVAVRVSLNGTRFCAVFDGAAVRRSTAGRFHARNADVATISDCDDATLQAPPCGEAAACDGTCPAGTFCASDAGTCSCVTPPNPCQVHDEGAFPVCGGDCPAGQICGNTGPYPSLAFDCGCVPEGTTACGDTFPACGGSCPDGTSCYPYDFPLLWGGTCLCATAPQPQPCDPGCPAGWSCELVGGQGYFCAPPPCQGGSGAPACDGTCGAGQDCMITPGDSCYCIDTCVGGDGFPACNGTCDRPGWTCQTGPESCGCLPPP